MKSWFVGLLLLICAQVGSASAAPIDVVFDIDWTTFYTIDPDNKNQMDNKAITVEHKTYRPTDHLGEVLERLLQYPDVRISFFSGGGQSRNEALLKAFKLPSGRSAFDISYKVLSKDNLIEVSTDQSLGFADRYKKNLAGVLPGAHVDRTILIDDQVKFAVPPWKIVDSMGHFEFQIKFDHITSGKAEYLPPTSEQWLAEKDKALMWLALIEQALHKSKRFHTPFSQELTKIWSQKSHLSLCKNVFAGN
ncbi:hypothetical protein ACLVWU_06310 [Bdellovibrio sp. HCB290]|uniref:hypothetical protein n=1 Tax=Bdellovibrio sp. HCB290 TaxID=3394356 RepID=UPI0039B6E558